MEQKEMGKMDKHDNICPHTSNPLQLKPLCSRCRTLNSLGVLVYQMPDELGGDWAAAWVNYRIADGFKNRHDAEEWALQIACKKLGIQCRRGCLACLGRLLLRMVLRRRKEVN